MKLMKTIWFTTNSGLMIGVVIGKDEITGEKKAYIDIAAGDDEEDDKKFIMDYGCKLPVEIIKEILKDLEK